jgi:hypothetical protein
MCNLVIPTVPQNDNMLILTLIELLFDAGIKNKYDKIKLERNLSKNLIPIIKKNINSSMGVTSTNIEGQCIKAIGPLGPDYDYYPPIKRSIFYNINEHLRNWSLLYSWGLIGLVGAISLIKSYKK